jgi:hypothetical protein
VAKDSSRPSAVLRCADLSVCCAAFAARRSGCFKAQCLSSCSHMPGLGCSCSFAALGLPNPQLNGYNLHLAGDLIAACRIAAAVNAPDTTSTADFANPEIALQRFLLSSLASTLDEPTLGDRSKSKNRDPDSRSILRTSSGARSCLRSFLKIPFARDMQIRSALRCNGQRCATHQVQSASALPQTWGPARRLYHRRGLP